MKKIIFVISLFFLLVGCSTNHFYDQVENVGDYYLASIHVKTPDDRQFDPPYGQRINISWYFPKNQFYQDLSMHLTVRFWDNTQETRVYNLHRRWGTDTFFFSNKLKENKNKILTYRIQIFNGKNEVIETWKHQFWTELINVDEETDQDYNEHFPKENIQIIR